jgi:putative NIF3 family GTP cyclohydrolase 1 type 2
MKTLLTILVMLIGYSCFSQTLNVRAVVNRMIEDQQTPIETGSVDTLIAGTWAQEVRGIATTFMATFDVIKRAQRQGLNLILTHEPTFYNHLDERDDYGEQDPVVLEKLRFIEEHDMVVFRYHDLPHRAQDDMINAGLVEKLGWNEFEIDDMVFQSPFQTLGELSRFLKDNFGAFTLRVVGDINMSINTIGVLPGAYGRQGQVAAFNSNGIDVLIVGEAREWETIEYARDALDMGGHTALIVLGHADSEEPGMEYVANWLEDLVPEVPVKFVPAGNPFWSPE